MAVRTFYWDDAARGPRALLRRALRRAHAQLRVGNAGDLYNRDLVRFLYGDAVTNIADDGCRLLLVGSTAHRLRDGDVLCGVGTKGTAVPPPSPDAARIRGVRGPRTRQALAEAGYDLRDLRFMLDPGLLAGSVYPQLRTVQPESNRVIFIPHYREIGMHADVPGVRIASSDSEPEALVREIARAEYVYTSSLHGLIFAHALGRPVQLVAPRTAEPEVKYRDYCESIGLRWRAPEDIHVERRRRPVEALDHVPTSLASFDFPPRVELVSLGIASGAGS